MKMDPQPADFYELLSKAEDYEIFCRAVGQPLQQPTPPIAPIDVNYSPEFSSPISVVNEKLKSSQPQPSIASERNQRLKEKQRLPSPPPNGHSATKDALPQIIYKPSGSPMFIPKIPPETPPHYHRRPDGYISPNVIKQESPPQSQRSSCPETQQYDPEEYISERNARKLTNLVHAYYNSHGLFLPSPSPYHDYPLHHRHSPLNHDHHRYDHEIRSSPTKYRNDKPYHDSYNHHRSDHHYRSPPRRCEDSRDYHDKRDHHRYDHDRHHSPRRSSENYHSRSPSPKRNSHRRPNRSPDSHSRTQQSLVKKSPHQNLTNQRIPPINKSTFQSRINRRSSRMCSCSLNTTINLNHQSTHQCLSLYQCPIHNNNTIPKCPLKCLSTLFRQQPNNLSQSMVQLLQSHQCLQLTSSARITFPTAHSADKP